MVFTTGKGGLGRLRVDWCLVCVYQMNAVLIIVSCSTLSHRLNRRSSKIINPRAHEKLPLGCYDSAAKVATSKGKGIIVRPRVVKGCSSWGVDLAEALV